MKPKILFVCIENSCRSQIAEAFAKKLGGDVVEAWSAGSRPSGVVNSAGISLMQEIGVDMSEHRSKGLKDLPTDKWDYVVTMGCGDACPFVPSRKTLDWKIPDPKNLPLSEFRIVRDTIADKVLGLVNEIKSSVV